MKHLIAVLILFAGIPTMAQVTSWRGEVNAEREYFQSEGVKYERYENYVGAVFQRSPSTSIHFRQQYLLQRFYQSSSKAEDVWNTGLGPMEIEYNQKDLFQIAGRNVSNTFRLYTPTGDREKRGKVEFRYVGVWGTPLAKRWDLHLGTNPRYYGYTKIKEPGDKTVYLKNFAEFSYRANQKTRIGLQTALAHSWYATGRDEGPNGTESVLDWKLRYQAANQVYLQTYLRQETDVNSKFQLFDGDKTSWFFVVNFKT